MDFFRTKIVTFAEVLLSFQRQPEVEIIYRTGGLEGRKRVFEKVTLLY